MNKTALMLSDFEWEILCKLQGSEVRTNEEVFTILRSIDGWYKLAALAEYKIEDVWLSMNSICFKFAYHNEFLVKLALNSTAEIKCRNVRDNFTYSIKFSDADNSSHHFKGRIVNYDRQMGIYDFAWVGSLIFKDIDISQFTIYGIESFGDGDWGKTLQLHCLGFVPREGWAGVLKEVERLGKREKSKFGKVEVKASSGEEVCTFELDDVMLVELKEKDSTPDGLPF